MPLVRESYGILSAWANMSDDYYQILGVSRGASRDEIARAYRKMARKYHPDVNPDDVGAKQRFQKVQGAFDVLSDPEKKSRYDQFGDNFESFGGAGASQFGGMDLEQIFAGGGAFVVCNGDKRPGLCESDLPPLVKPTSNLHSWGFPLTACGA